MNYKFEKNNLSTYNLSPITANRLRGVTIVELMVVVVIIGILAALVIPQFERAIEEARFKEATSVLKSIRGAEKVFKARKGNYVGVNIDGTAAAKQAWWDLLNIEVIDTPNEWTYGVGIDCGCNTGGDGGGWGDDPDNGACIPFARRETGPNAGNVIHITMTAGVIDALDSNDPCEGVVSAVTPPWPRCPNQR